jgi:hypothetical protein
MAKAKNRVLSALKKASKGLLFPSESDEPLEPFLWKDAGDQLTQDRVRALAGVEEGASVEEMSLDDLFQTVPGEDRPPFQKLVDTLQEKLTGLKVYKVGDEPEKEVYLVGKTEDGHWAGLKTTVVET